MLGFTRFSFWGSFIRFIAVHAVGGHTFDVILARVLTNNRTQPAARVSEHLSVIRFGVGLRVLVGFSDNVAQGFVLALRPLIETSEPKQSPHSTSALNPSPKP